VSASLPLLGCCSTSKAQLELALLRMDKSARMREVGLQRRPMTFRGETTEFVYLHAPAQRGPGRTPVVLIHGTPSTLFTWAELALGGSGGSGLNAERDVYMIEVVGHGIAPEGTASVTFQDCADYVAEAVSTLGLPPAFLVGQSYGGEFAWRAALDRPELWAGLALISSSGVTRRTGDWLPEEVQMRENRFAALGWLLNSRSRVASALAPHYRELTQERIEEFYLVCNNRSNWRAMIDLARDENGAREADLARLALPTLLLWGEQDRGYDPGYYAQRFAELIPGAALELLPGTGHYLHEEVPEEAVERLERFFTSVESQE
jgi:pimeloyl-ACP methyl ester carboxylesterase